MAAETATPVEPADSSKASCIPSADVRRHISTSSQHSDHTLCNEPMAAPAARTPQAVKLGMQPQPARRASEDSASLAQAIAAGSPRVEKRPSLMQRFLGAPGAKRASPPPSVHSSASTAPRRGAGSEVSTTFEQKYGTCSRECIGRGATAVVRVAYKQHRDGPQVYAIKRFRKQRANETEREYIKKLTSEYCISSSLHHKNVVSTLDLIQDPQKNWCQVMEFCPGGDLYTVIRDGSMGLPEHECCFKQLCQGIAHLHALGVCHRDIKAENLLLDAHNTVKITDFGVADVFRVAWEERIHKSRGLCGSEPYIAPEMFAAKSYDGRKADVWSAAIVYYTMVYNGIPWRAAKDDDPNYARFLEAVRAGRDYEGFRRMDARSRRLVQRMLNPDPQARPTIDEVLESDVMQRICVCDDAGRVPGGGSHCHYTEEYEERLNSRRMRAQAHHRP
ncbi:hypothetical protein LPJ63_003372 [Coemansia sp. RSA 2711]|nr:hypothetical protein LPJ63_003372 [Coemansia sp. RSA 2711]KAJ2362793.1 hypothetical protein H4S01_004617 [Coemansia sp. RSA 2610]KAJ2381966.1 hypothetical protein H4S02_005969 [Coemansia sp. RSA 2611]